MTGEGGATYEEKAVGAIAEVAAACPAKGSSPGTPSSAAGGAPPVRNALIRTRTTWQRAGAVVGRDVRARRAALTWDKTVGGSLRRLWLALKTRHSLFSGVLFHGAGDLSRAQTLMVFVNSVALQLVLVSLMYVPRVPGQPLTINPIKIAVSGTVASLITMPMSMTFALIYRPILLARVLFKLALRLVTLLLCLPCVCAARFVRWQRQRRKRRASRRVADSARREPGNLVASKAIARALKGRCQKLHEDSAARRRSLALGGEAIVVRDAHQGASPPAAATDEEGGAVRVKPSGETKGATSEETQMERFVDGLLGGRGHDTLFSRSMRNDLDLLASAAPRIAPHTMDEVSASGGAASRRSAAGATRRGAMRRRRRIPRKLRALVLGWCINVCLLLAMLQLFLLYVCEFASTEGSSESSQVLVERELMWSWGWSIMQRVLFNEPLMIISVRGLPMLLRAQCARQLCSEALLEYVAQAVETGAGIAKEAIA